MYKFGIISTASISARVIDAIRLTGNEVVSIASRDIAKAKEYALSHGIKKYYGSYEDIYNDQEVDILYIPVVNTLHFECAKNALMHHKHVLLEKPFTTNKKGAEELFKVAKEHNCFLMEGVKNVFMPSTAFIKDNLELIGKVLTISTKQGTKKKFNENHWMYKKEMGGGAYIGSCAYCYHLIMNIFNDYIKDVKAEMIKSHLSSDKYVDFTYKIKDIDCHSIINMEEDEDNQMVIVGEKGKIIVDTFWRSHNVKIYKDDKLIKEFNDDGNEFIHQINHVTYCLDNKLLTSDIIDASRSIEEASLIEEVLTKTN